MTDAIDWSGTSNSSLCARMSDPPAEIFVHTPFRWVWLARWAVRRHPASSSALYWLPPRGFPPHCGAYRAERQPGRHPWRRWRWRAVR